MSRKLVLILVLGALAGTGCAKVTIGDYVWWDVNFNGIQDNGEPGIEGVTLRLYNDSDELVDTAVTDRDGIYGFTESIDEGEYEIEIQRPANSHLTMKDARDDDTVDSDFDPVSFRTDPFQYTGDEDLTRDAGLLRSGDTDPTPTPTPTQTPTPTATPPMTSHNTFNEFLDILDISLAGRQQLVDLHREDAMGDWIFSRSDREPGMKVPHTDLWGHTAAPVGLGQDVIDSAFGGEGPFVCGNTLPGHIVVCPDNPQPMLPGEYLLIASVFNGPIPLDDPDNFYVYSAVFDADGDPANNFTFFFPFDWDLYQNTDLWFELVWAANQGQWFFGANQAGTFQQLPTAARAMIWDDMVVFFIPISEFGVPRPGYRVTSFCHDGTFNAATSGADVNGADPTIDTEIVRLELQSAEPIQINGIGSFDVSVP